MVMKQFVFYFFLLLIFCVSNTVNAQFYYGLQQPFGKNRVQYNNFFWSYYEFERFETYFYGDGKDLAKYVGKVANIYITEIEQIFDSPLHENLQIIIFNSLTDLKQSNINLSSDEAFNTGGTTHIAGNRMIIYFDGNHKNLHTQLRAGITEITLNKIIYGENFRQAIKNNALVSFPNWYTKGLISYISKPDNIETDNYVRDGVLFGKYKNFNSLTGEDAIHAGHSIWKYIAETYSKKVIGNILYMSMINKNLDGGFVFVLGKSLNEVTEDWLSYNKRKYEDNELSEIIITIKKNKKLLDLKCSPTGEYIAYTTHDLGRYKIWLYNNITSKKKCIHTSGNRIAQNADYSFPILSFNPVNNILAFITEKKGFVWLNLYDIESKETLKKPIYHFNEIHDFSYSPNGKNMVMSASKNGVSDIVIYNIASNSYKKLTDDIFDDLYPTYISSNRIIFSSNRLNDSIKTSIEYDKVGDYNNLYLFDENKPKLLRKLNNNESNLTNPELIANNKIAFLNQNNGNTRQFLELDSSISFVDTTIHYKYFSRIYNSSKSTNNIFHFQVHNENFYDALLENNRFYIIKDSINFNKKNPIKNNQTNTKKNNKSKEPEDLKINKKIQSTENFDVNINNYQFENKLYNSFNYKTKKNNLPDTIVIKSNDKKTINLKKEFKLPKQKTYFTSFYADYFTSQVDNSYTFATYQPFSGGTSLFLNPNFNALFELGISDIMEDYKIVGGIRLSFDLNNNEYYLKFQNQKYRLDKETIFYKKTTTEVIDEYGFYFVKSNTHHLKQVLIFPINEVTSIKGTFGYRNDKNSLLSTDYFSLNEPNLYDHWFTSNLQYIFDNTRVLQTNILKGSKYKFFTEYYQEIDEEKQTMTTIGFDFRHYLPLHKNLIIASRVAAATSFGKKKLIYYMGGVDNWMAPKFNDGNSVDLNQGYAFQTIATNMRGFHQNIRNGNSFTVINTEIRWPVVKYFIKKPLKSQLLEDLQLIGFSDIGTAWTGNSPYSDENSLNIEEVQQGPINVTLNKQIEPIVFSYGFGFRTTLLGYFIRLDIGWGIEDYIKLPPVIHFSFGLDF